MISEIQTFNIRGERCSGTNYLQQLVETNLQIPYKQDGVGWKHGFYNANIRQSLVNLDTSLTLVIFRNPFDWVRSLYLNPHHFEGNIKSVWQKDIQPTFSEFIRKEVRQDPPDVHPLYLDRAKNIFELRKWKTEHFLNLKKVLKHVYYIKYEDLAENPNRIVKEINDKWLNKTYRFKDWNFYKYHTDRKYVPCDYFEIIDEDYRFIVDSIDWQLESQIGYTI